MSFTEIQLRGVAVHNLKNVDLDIPHGKLVVFCGVSGSGKSSMALDTLYAEGQRRYIETFPAYTRQFLERLEKPDAERIDGIPPAVAVTRKTSSRSIRSTVGTATELTDYLRLMYAKIATVCCPGCRRPVRCDTPASAGRRLNELPEGSRYMLGFPATVAAEQSADGPLGVTPPAEGQPPADPTNKRSPGGRSTSIERLVEDGFVRGVVGEDTVNLAELDPADVRELIVIVDRLTARSTPDGRTIDSLETAFRHGLGRSLVLLQPSGDQPELPTVTVDGRSWQRLWFSSKLRCEDCGIDFPLPEPGLFNFNNPLGACPTCEGFGNVAEVDMDLVVPDLSQTLRDGAIAPWNSPAYKHELDELIALADDYSIPLDVPFRELDARARRLIDDGVPERNFGGLKGFFAWLEKRTYKTHLRAFLSRWRSHRECPDCRGKRLRPGPLAFQIGGKAIADMCGMKVETAIEFFTSLELTPRDRTIAHVMLDQVRSRLGYLDRVGLAYLTLDRTLRTLSGGELQRVFLTGALGSSLVNMLYVLDEPSAGLHPADCDRLIEAMEGLRNRQNTVVVVEHEESVLQQADEIVEFGPEAGDRGGNVVFQGTPTEMLDCAQSVTGDFLAGRRGVSVPEQRRQPGRGRIHLVGARGNNLQNLTVEFPLGLLCVVTGVSGSGKSTLVQDTLYGALCRRKRKDAPPPYPCEDIFGDGQIDDVLLVDQNPIGRSPRSNPVTYIKAFDEIRNAFAATIDAKTHNYTAGHFSFNVDGGRCNQCNGDGHIAVDMQFLADIYRRCPQCHGKRYRREILEVMWRGRNIADVLGMTVREAFTFFRGRPKVQAKLKRLIDVGLDYLQLGQPANTLSGGESQRLKLAAHMSTSSRNRTLFILDEPTTGLHFADIVRLLDCFDALIDVGHSLIVVEHNLQVMRAADYLIDLGPGAGESGGRVVAHGSPEDVMQCAESLTGRYLKASLGDR